MDKGRRYVDQNAEGILGQIMFAIGQGAAGVHLHRRAVTKLRDRFEDPVYDLVTKHDWKEIWHKEAMYTLRYCEVIGRLAAHAATKDGTPTIDAHHLDEARQTVEARYEYELKHPVDRGAGPDPSRGKICP